MPPIVIPYASSAPYDNSAYVTRMADLMLRRGDVQADALRRAGDARAQMWGNVGNVALSTMGQIGAARDAERQRAILLQQQAFENQMKQRTLDETIAERKANEQWRRDQFRAQGAESAADNIAPGTDISAEDFKRYEGLPAAVRFRRLDAIPAQPAWETEPEGDAMAESGPATPAVDVRYRREPNAQEAASLKQLMLQEQDRAFRERQATLDAGAQLEERRRTQGNFDKQFNRGVYEFNTREAREKREFDATQQGSLFNNGTSPELGVTGEDYLKTVPPRLQELVKSIADYKADLSKVTSLRGNERQRLAAMVMQYDPTFDMSQYGARSALRREFVSGKAAANIRSLNTAVGHLNDLSKAAGALDNYSWQFINSVTNWASEKTGDPRVTNFKVKANAVEGELASVFKGTGATDQEIKAWREAINSSQSPEQLKGVIEGAIELMGSRMNALTSQFETGLRKPKDFQILNQKSRKILEGLGFDPDTMERDGTVAKLGGKPFFEENQ